MAKISGSYDFQGQEQQKGAQEKNDAGELELMKDKYYPPWYKRQDLWLWIGGHLFIIALLGAIFGIGIAREWSANSGFTHNDSVTSQERFLPEPDTPEPGVRGRYGPEASARWYYWKLKPDNLSFWTHFFPWACYVGHQITIWGVIYKTQMAKAYEPPGIKARYSPYLSWFNLAALGVNVAFHLLHLAQTHITYDATAQDVSVSTSQASVVMMLTVIFMMEYRERGLFFGWPTTRHKSKISQKLRLSYTPLDLFKRYHGYAFAWASIYTFWYHPMENTWGHAMGFIYTWIVLLQGCLIYTDLHLNKYWRLFIEAYVILHGGVVAYQTGGPDLNGTRLWPMFVFGFALAFVLTQIFSLPVWNHVHPVFNLAPFIIYMGIVVGSYSVIYDAQGRNFVRMQEIIRIPSIYYLYFFVGYLLIFLCLCIEKKSKKNPEVTTNPLARFLWLSGVVIVYGAMVGLAIMCEKMDWQLGLIVLMIMFVGMFMVGVIISSMFLRQVIPYRIKAEVDQIDTPEEKDNSAFTHESDQVDASKDKSTL